MVSVFQRVRDIFATNHFFRSSAIITIVNLFNAFLNYLLIVLVSNLIATQLSNWTSLNGIITIFSAPIVAANLEASRQVAKLSKNNSDSIPDYFRFLEKLNIKLSKYYLGFSILLLSFAFVFTQNIQTIGLILATLLFFYFNYVGGNYVQFLIGDVKTLKAGFGSLLNGISRFVSSVTIIYLGAGVLALPLGQMIGFLLAFLVARYFIVSGFTAPPVSNITKLEFSLRQYFEGLSKTVVVLCLMYVLLYSTAIISNLFLVGWEKDFFAVIFNFGQITFFGATAFMSVFLAHSSRKADKKVYLQSLTISSVINVLICLGFFVFNAQILQIFKRSQYQSEVGMIIYFLFAILVYNVLYISVQNLLAQENLSKIRTLLILAFVMIIGVTLVVASPLVIYSHIFTFISAYIFGLLVLTAYAVYLVFNEPISLEKH